MLQLLLGCGAMVDVEQLQTPETSLLFHNHSMEATLLLPLKVLGGQHCSRLTLEHTLHHPLVSLLSVELLHGPHQRLHRVIICRNLCEFVQIEPKPAGALHFCDYNRNHVALLQVPWQLLCGDGFANGGGNHLLRTFSRFCLPQCAEAWAHRDAFAPKPSFCQLHRSNLGHSEQQVGQVHHCHVCARVSQLLSQRGLVYFWFRQHNLFHPIGQLIKALCILSLITNIIIVFHLPINLK